MKRLLLLALALPVLPGCSGGVWLSWLGIPPGKEEYSVKSDMKDTWVAVRDVLADRGYQFEEADREEWELRTRWNGYGSDEFYGNKRWKIRLHLEEAEDGGTIICMSAELQRNSGRNLINPEDEDWESLGSDHNEEELIHRMVMIRLNKNKDHWAETYRRLDREDKEKNRVKEPVNYEEDGRTNK